MPRLRARFLGSVLVLSCVAAASTWFYVDSVLKAEQIADATVHNRPRGNLSDLYPRWLGARELLLHGRNPYSSDVTVEIQRGYYGRPLDPRLPNDPKDQQGFAYPIYVVFLLAPTIHLPFTLVQACFRWLLVALAVSGVLWWLIVLRWKLSWLEKLIPIILLLGCFPEAQGIRLQQLSLLVAALLAAGCACAASGYLFVSGAILALATIKPQLALPLVVWLTVWTTSEWKTRWRWAAGFAVTMALLLAASEIVLPGWIRMFVDALREYRQYTGNQSVLDPLVNWAIGPFGGRILSLVAVSTSVVVLWPLRRHGFDSEDFGRASALVMALTILVARDSPYNQVLLMLAILLLVRERYELNSNSPGMRALYALGMFTLMWPWLASISLVVVSLFSRPVALNHWQWPLYATFALPVMVFVLTLACLRHTRTLRAREFTR